MSLEMTARKIKCDCVIAKDDETTVDVMVWDSFEGCNVMATNIKDSQVRLAASLSWAEIDLLLVALNAARH